MTQRKLVPSFRRLVGFLFCSIALAAVAAEPAKRSFDLPAGNADQALKRLAEQSGREVLFPADAVEGIRTKAVKGEMTPQEALDAMLAGTPLVGVQDEKTGSLTVRREASVEKAEKNAPSRPASDRAATGEKIEGTLKLDTFEVMGTKLLNMDVQRSRDDAQPYVIFDRTMLEQSGATDVNQFLRQRLTMNTQAFAPNEFPAKTNRSQINLRGLGETRTLILVDGHRLPDFNLQGTLGQSDINNIPMAAIERIEILPTTAGGIYGGNAVGGVVNVILRRDYAGAEVRLTYDNTFDTDSAIRRIDLSDGFTLENGKTSVLLAASYSDTNGLVLGDRDFTQTYLRDRPFANNPSRFLPPATTPIGSTPNIRSTSGNLVLKNGTPLNSLFTFVPAGYAGTAADGGAALVANAGRYNLTLADSAQSSDGARFGLVGATTTKSLITTVRRSFGDRVQAFLDTGYADGLARFPNSPLVSIFSVFTIPSTAPNNPFQQTISVSMPYRLADGEYISQNDSRRAVAGVVIKLPHDWQAEADLTWSRYITSIRVTYPGSLTAAGTTAIGNGTVDILRDTIAFPPDLSAYENPIGPIGPWKMTLRDATVRAAGSTFDLPAGPVKVSLLAEARDENFSDATATQQTGLVQYYPAQSQSVMSTYAEGTVPLVGAKQHWPLVESIDLQPSVRWDRYTTHGATRFISANFGSPLPLNTIGRSTNEVSSTNYSAGLKWKLNSSLILRASYGTGFLPPDITQLQPTTTATVTVTDPRRGNTATVLSGPAGAFINGGNSRVQPERSDSWSAGMVFTPSQVPGFRLSLDYTRIKYRDKISAFPGGQQALVNNESLFPDRVVRGANLPGDPPDWAGPITLLDASLFNIASVELVAWDLQCDYRRQFEGLGEFAFYAVASWQPHYRTQTLVGQPFIENVGFTSTNPLEYRASGGVTWTRGHWTLGWNTRYYDSYRVYAATDTPATAANSMLTQGGRRIRDQIYHDAFATYRFGASGQRFRGLTRGLELTVGFRDVFNSVPPYDATGGSSNGSSQFGDPRLASYYFALRKAF